MHHPSCFFFSAVYCCLLLFSCAKVLELEEIADRLIGSEASGGLSLEQRKRTTLGVELAANPSLVLLDEPTSGLDARSAQVHACIICVCFWIVLIAYGTPAWLNNFYVRPCPDLYLVSSRSRQMITSFHVVLIL